jgi:ribose-phosphate pyrophosphokinase
VIAIRKRNEMIVIPGPASVELGKKVAAEINAGVVPVEFKRFPDGESYIRFDGAVEGRDVVIVQTTGPPQNENLVQLLLLADNAEDMGAKSTTAVVPYLAYARQDNRFRAGEALSVKTIVTLLKQCGVSRIVTVNSHNPGILRTLSVPVEDLSAITLLAQHLKKQGLKNAVSLSPGKKGLNTALEASKVLGGKHDYIPTQRDRITGNVTIEKKAVPIRDKDVVIFDDIISSGGTMIKLVACAREQGAKRIYVACVHLMPIGDAIEKILDNGADGIVSTDTVPSQFSFVSVAPLIAQALKK